MTGITRSADHRYTYEGVTYPGVTGILKVIDKSDALMGWAARNTAEAAIALLPGGELARMLEAVGPEGVTKALTARSSWKRDEAASLGTEVHTLADQLVRHEHPVVPERAVKHVKAYSDWWANAGWTVRASEAFVIKATPQWGYGGTIDLLCRDRDGCTVLADIKTGKGVYSEAVLQLTAYGNAEKIQTATGIYPMPHIDRYAILHVTAEGVREVEVNIGDLELQAWYGAIDLSAWHKTLKGKRL